MPNCDKQLSLCINGASAEQILGLTSEQARCLKLLNQSTWARQWSKAWISSCVTTLFIWDCWWILFWHKTICKHTMPHSFLMLKKTFRAIRTCIRTCTTMNWLLPEKRLHQSHHWPYHRTLHKRNVCLEALCCVERRKNDWGAKQSSSN